MPNITDADEIVQHARPVIHQRGHDTQPYGHLAKLPIALEESTCKQSVEHLNQLLADTITIRDLYKKYHWQVAGHTFYQLHLLFDKHAEEQTELIDEIAERIQLLGGVSVAMAHDVAERHPEALPWKALDVQIVVEASGAFETYVDARRHIDAGAAHVVLTAPAKDDDADDARTVLMGVNPQDVALSRVVERVLHDELRRIGH